MSVIDLNDKVKVNNVVDVKFGEKTWKLIFNDEYRKKVQIVAEEVQELFDKTDDDSEWAEKLEKATPANKKKMLTSAYDSISKTIIEGLDELLGEGAGQYLYDAYNHSTEKLSAIVQLLNDEADKVARFEKDAPRAKALSQYDTER